jgi:glycyl-tRNA synthetase beta chain
MSKDFLLELGVEEMPARFVEPARRFLGEELVRRLAEAGLPHGKMETFATPRRLAAVVHSLAEKAKDTVKESLGPSLAQAKDDRGQWTPAALGFARGQGMTPEQLETRPTDRGPRLAAVHRLPGRPTKTLLPELLPDVVKKITFPKTMTWESGGFRFARPLRWIGAVWGGKPVRFTLAGVKAGTTSQGLRFHGKKSLTLPAPARYASFFKDQCVIVDPAERRDLIVKQIQQAVKACHGRVFLDRDQALVDEVTQLVEHPVAVLGRFDEAYLSLPPEVLVTSMKKRQKFFPVFSFDGKSPFPFFVGIRNGISVNQEAVREGYERVLAARLADAAFFYGRDRKVSLFNHAVDLKGVAFLSPQLSVVDKTVRVSSLALGVAHELGLSNEACGEVNRICVLAKADLVTGMVGEFPELQGVVGRIYALADGEPPAVAAGVEQHYWPLTADGPLPESPATALVALADKMDTLAGNFLLGKIPSGSQDPYGLRRAAVGVLRILREREWAVSLDALISRALELLPESLGDRGKAGASLGEFFRQRWSALMEAGGFRPDDVLAVVGSLSGGVADAEKRLAALAPARRGDGFDRLTIAFKRSANILFQAGQKKLTWPDAVPTADLTDPSEKTLHTAVTAATETVRAKVAAGLYPEALAALVTLREPVDDFFSAVMVFDPHPASQAARLALLAQVDRLFRSVADFSRLQDTPATAAATK